ncbi:MAG: hypothetical protein AB8B71_07190 [Paracoccaceae bacterium]
MFAKSDEDIVLVWDDSQTSEPKVTLKSNMTYSKFTDILLDGALVAHVPTCGAMTPLISLWFPKIQQSL